MFQRRWLTVFAATSALLAAIVVADDKKGDEKHAEPPKNPALEKMRQLAGQWIESEPEAGKTAQLVSVFKVVGAGSAVAETMFPDTPHEMITMYHLDGDTLMLTHYCAAGNQPQMKAKAGKDADKLEFEFTGGTNVDMKKGLHMHSLTITFVDADNIIENWTHYEDGKATGEATFKLKRKK